MNWIELRDAWVDRGLSRRVAHRIALEGIATDEDLSKLTYAELLRIPDLGVKAADEIVSYLGKYGVTTPAGYGFRTASVERWRKANLQPIWSKALEQAAKIVEQIEDRAEAIAAIRSLPFDTTVDP